MKIKKINFYSVLKSEGCTCDCCGKYITNVCSIDTVGGGHFNLGSTCFDKQMKTKLGAMAKKKVNHAVKMIKSWNEEKEYMLHVSEEQYKIDRPADYEERVASHQYDGIDCFEDYRKWNLEEFIPYRISLAEADIVKYGVI